MQHRIGDIAKSRPVDRRHRLGPHSHSVDGRRLVLRRHACVTPPPQDLRVAGELGRAGDAHDVDATRCRRDPRCAGRLPRRHQLRELPIALVVQGNQTSVLIYRNPGPQSEPRVRCLQHEPVANTEAARLSVHVGVPTLRCAFEVEVVCAQEPAVEVVESEVLQCGREEYQLCTRVGHGGYRISGVQTVNEREPSRGHDAPSLLRIATASWPSWMLPGGSPTRPASGTIRRPLIPASGVGPVPRSTTRYQMSPSTSSGSRIDTRGGASAIAGAYVSCMSIGPLHTGSVAARSMERTCSARSSVPCKMSAVRSTRMRLPEITMRRTRGPPASDSGVDAI